MRGHLWLSAKWGILMACCSADKPWLGLAWFVSATMIETFIRVRAGQ